MIETTYRGVSFYMMNLAILFGGTSNEHEISLLSSAAILRNLDGEKYRVLPVGITREGQWYLCEGIDPDLVENGSWEQQPGNVPALLVPDRGIHGLLALREGRAETVRVDCVFPALHGAGGEDGTIQGLCALAGIPCVGPGVAASANAMDKSLTKRTVEGTGVRQAAYALVLAPDYARDPAAAARAAAERIGSWPVFVKPCSSGSSVGVAAAGDLRELEAGLAEAFRWDSKVLVEKFIDGREIEVAVLGNQEPVASVAGEIAPTQEFYTFDAKYRDDSSKLYIPARIPQQAMQTVREAAVRVYTALGCRGLSRVDFFCTRDGDQIVFNEINTIPGFTSISMYPKLFAHGGLPFPALLDRLISLAMEEEPYG